MASRNTALALECKRLSESCLYTSTQFFIYVRWLRWIRIGFVAIPLVLGSLATWKVVSGAESYGAKWFAAICAFLAGLLPSIYSALKLDDRLAEAARLAAEFKNLQDRFRQAALVTALKKCSDFEAEFATLMQRLEDARRPSLTPPEYFFKRAQKKIKSGDYEFDVDIAQIEAANRELPPGAPQAPAS